MILQLSIGLSQSDCGYNASEIKVAIRNLNSGNTAFTVTMEAIGDPVDYQPYVWDSNGKVIPPTTGEPYFIESTVNAAPNECACIRFDWMPDPANPSGKIFGYGRYILRLFMGSNQIGSVTVDYRGCKDPLGPAPDISLRYDYSQMKLLYQAEQSCDVGGINPPAVIYAPGLLDAYNCLEIPMVIENRFRFAQGDFSEDYLILNDACAQSSWIPSGQTVMLTGYPFFSLQPRYHKYTGLGSEPNSEYRFYKWRHNDTKAIMRLTNESVDKPRAMASDFLYKANATLRLEMEGNPFQTFLKIRDYWKTVYQSCIALQDMNFNDYEVPTTGFDLGSFSNYGGIFLNQGGLIEHPTPPYYTLRASKYLSSLHNYSHRYSGANLSVGDLVFAGWKENPLRKAIFGSDPLNNGQPPYNNPEQYDTKVVKFIEDGVSVTASYKAHRLSNKPASETESSSPTSPNSQRKIDVANNILDPPHIAVYESMGEVWLKKSTDQGLIWSPELILSDTLGIALHPSISVSNDEAAVAFIDNTEIVVGKYANDAFTQFDFLSLYSPTPDAAPVVAHNAWTGLTFVVYEASDVNIPPGSLAYLVFDQGNIVMQGTVPLMPGMIAERPSLSNDGGNAYEIVWFTNGEIWHKTAYLFPPTGIAWSIITPLPLLGDVAVGAPSIAPYQPGAAPNNFTAVVANEATDGTYNKVNICVKTFNGWSHLQQIYTSNSARIWAPSISSFALQGCSGAADNIRCAFNLSFQAFPGMHQIFVLSLNCGSWNMSNTQVTDALHPSTVAFPVPGFGMDIFTKLNSQNIPQPLVGLVNEIATSKDLLNKNTAAVSLNRSRELILSRDTTLVRFGLGDIHLLANGNKSRISWARGFDTLIVGKTITVEQDYRTSPFTLTTGSVLKYVQRDGRRGHNAFPSGLDLKIQVLDANTNAVLTTLGQHPVNNIAQGRRVLTSSFAMPQFVGREIYLRMQLIGIDSTVSLYGVDYYNLDPNSSVAFPKDDAEEFVVNTLPQSTTLEQNAPNPFTFATDISFSLPLPARVRLVVYDNLGRAVKTIVEGEREAGRHTLTFDASGLPSGMYVYRLESGSERLTRGMFIVK